MARTLKAQRKYEMARPQDTADHQDAGEAHLRSDQDRVSTL